MTDLVDRPAAADANGFENTETSAIETSALNVDVAALGEQLLGRWADARRRSREFMKDPAMWRDPALGMDEHRERVLGQLKLLVENGSVHRAFPKKFGGDDDHGGFLAAFE